MDGEHALGASGGAAKGLLDGVTQNALAEMPVQLPEALGRGVVHGQDEAEVDGIPEPARVLAEGLSDGGFIAPHGAVALADSVELTPLPVGQPLLAVGDVAHLRAGSTRVSVIASLDEEHVRPPRPSAPRPGLGEVSFRVDDGLLPLVGADVSQLGHQLLLADLHGPVAGRPVGQEALRSEGGRTEKLEQETNALDRSEQLLDAPARDAIAVADRLDSDSQTLPDGLGPSRPAALGVGLDLADEVGRNPRRDPLEGGLDGGGFGLRAGA